MRVDQIIQICIIVFVIAAIAAAVVFVRIKIRNFSREAFGTDSFLEGYKEKKRQLSETPRSVPSMTQIYLPQLQKDFPEFDYELYKNKAEALLRSYFNAIAGKSPESLEGECTSNLETYVRGIVEDLNAQCHTQYFAETVIHNTQLARYIKNGATVTILFNSAVGQYSYITDDETGKVVFGDKDLKKQTLYEIGLVYIQDPSKVRNAPDGALGINCPNCGAPIMNIGNKFCQYCGTAVREVNIRAWHFDSVRELTVRKTAY